MRNEKVMHRKNKSSTESCQQQCLPAKTFFFYSVCCFLRTTMKFTDIWMFSEVFSFFTILFFFFVF